MHATIQRAVGILNEAGLPDRAIGAQEYGRLIEGAMIRGGVDLWIILRASAADGGLGMALEATLAIEGRSQTKKRTIGSIRSCGCPEH